MITRANAFFLGRRRTAQEYFFKSLFLNQRATMNEGRIELEVVKPYLKPDSVIVDIGAHVGVFSRRLAKLAPDSVVIAFEPQTLPRSVFTLAGFMRAPCNILVMPFALGVESGLIDLSIPIKAKGGIGIGLAHVGDDADFHGRFEIKKELVPIVRLDDVMAQLDLGPVSLVKVDVEGGELNALKGATQLLASQKPAILCEIDGREHRFGSTSRELCEFLMEFGYQPRSIESDKVLDIEQLEKNTLFVVPE